MFNAAELSPTSQIGITKVHECVNVGVHDDVKCLLMVHMFINIITFIVNNHSYVLHSADSHYFYLNSLTAKL